MMQKLYRMLEMNFESVDDRETMSAFARTGVYDFNGDNSDRSSSHTYAHVPLRSSDEEDEICSIDNKKDQIDDETDSNESLEWAPEKRFHLAPTPRSENRFKSFRRK